jgi:hypothetical protein
MRLLCWPLLVLTAASRTITAAALEWLLTRSPLEAAAGWQLRLLSLSLLCILSSQRMHFQCAHVCPTLARWMLAYVCGPAPACAHMARHVGVLTGWLR